MPRPILIVETGTATSGLLLSRVISQRGFGPAEVITHPAKALEALGNDAQRYRLVILHRPVMEGHQDVLAAIRRAPELAELPVIVLSGSADQGSIRAALEDGADGYLLIPFSSDSVCRALERTLKAAADRTPIAAA